MFEKERGTIAQNDTKDIPIKRKNILVVYTKADLLLRFKQGLEPLPPEAIDYLGTDPYSQIRTKRSTELPPFEEDIYFALDKS
jgi:hypothetical protein